MTIIHPMSALRSSKGYTLIELMTIVVIVGLLSSFAIPKYQGYMEKARTARCIAEIRYFERDIQAYYVEHEKYPNSLGDLGRTLPNLLDPWGNPYQYLLIAGTKWASNGGGDAKYYARSNWNSGLVTAASRGEKGFWSSSWFVSEAWATPPGNGGGGQGGGGQGGGGQGGGGQGGGGGGSAKPRKDRFLVPINSDYDLYSMGPDGQSNEPLVVPVSRDDIIRASDGAYVGVAENF